MFPGISTGQRDTLQNLTCYRKSVTDFFELTEYIYLRKYLEKYFQSCVSKKNLIKSLAIF